MFMYVFEVSLHIFLYTYGTHFKANNPQQVAETSWQSGEYTHFDTVWPPLKNPGYTPEKLWGYHYSELYNLWGIPGSLQLHSIGISKSLRRLNWIIWTSHFLGKFFVVYFFPVFPSSIHAKSLTTIINSASIYITTGSNKLSQTWPFYNYSWM